MMKMVLTAALLLGTAAQAAPIQLADGQYSCSLSPTMILGSIWIKGGSYIGPSNDPKGPSHKFTVTDSGTINWSAPMGGMDSGGNKVVSTVIRDAGHGKKGFDMVIRVESGNFHTASCGPVS
jgi:hypothetical protein